MSRLFHVSDLHFGMADDEALDWFRGIVHAEQPDAVLITGDLTMRARSREYAAAADWLGKLGVPMSIEVGNHDLPYFNLWNRFTQPYARFDRIERALEKPIALTDVAIIPLRTTARFQWRTNWSHGRVSEASLGSALAGLRVAAKDRLRIVTCHHPLVDKPGGHSRGATANGREALFALAEAGADIVLSGHVHDAFDVTFTEGSRPLRMIGAGTLSERLRETRPSFNVLDVTGRDVTLTTRLFDVPVNAAEARVHA